MSFNMLLRKRLSFPGCCLSVPTEQGSRSGCWEETVTESPAMSSPKTHGGTVRSLETLLSFMSLS